MNNSEHKQKLLEQASSHGPYLWSSADIQNALLWFRPSDATAQSKDDAMEGRDFLRHLLHSPGINFARRRKRREGGTSDGRKSSSVVAGKKRKRGATGVQSDDVLSFVLKGYYQLHLPREAAVSDNSEMKPVHDDTIRQNGTSSTNRPADVRCISLKDADLASFQLQQDLNSIILSRQRTQELYKAALEHTAQTQHTSKKIPRGLQMNMLIDEYMTHPNTAILRAYTSNLYDRYTNLSLNRKEGFIHKMLMSTKWNARIQQVIFLFLLEPLRRLYVQKLQKSIEKRTASQPESFFNQSESHEQLASKISMYPLLTSDTIYSDISCEQTDQECSREPMQQIIDFIMQSAPGKTVDGKDDRVNSDDMCWWSLPSPLLCFLSQLYFPIACGYIRYCIKAAISAYDKLYSLDNNPASKPQSDHGSNSDGTFDSVMLRIQHFNRTSQRLEKLTHYMMSMVEEECQSSIETNMISLDEDEVPVDDAAFRMRLVWNAIRRSLRINMAGACNS